MSYYSVPPSVATASFTTAAVANTDTVRTLIPAPGVGFAIRVIAVAFSVNSNGAGNLDFRGSSFGWMANGNRGNASPWMLPPPGFQQPENTPVTVTERADIINQNYSIAVYYYTDDVS